MKPLESVARARSVIGKGCRYVLGKGGMKGDAPAPWGDVLACDCSGMAMWALGSSRLVGDLWYDTTRIYNEARKDGALFSEIPWRQAAPGDLVVYPDANGHQGHVGVVATVTNGPSSVVHCSMGNWHSTGDAIRETPPDVFMGKSIIARYTKFDAESDTPPTPTNPNTPPEGTT